MRPTEKKIQNLLKKLTNQTRPELDEKILNDCFTELNAAKSSAPVSSPNIWSIIMHSKMIKPIAAAIIIIVALLSLTLLDQTVAPAYALEQTVQALRGVRSLRMTLSAGPVKADLLMLINTQTGRADHIRMQTDSGDVTITIPGQTYMYQKQNNTVTFLPQELLRNDLNFKDVINSLVEQTGASDGRIEILNQFSQRAQKQVISVTIIRKDQTVAGEFLIDPESRLPIYLGTDAGGTLNYMGPIEYNIDIPTDAFEFAIPAGAAVTDQRPEELKNQQTRPDEPFSYDLRQTAAAMQAARNVHGTWIDRKGRRVESWATLRPDGTAEKIRMRYEDGGLYIMADDKTYFEDDGMKAIREGFFFNVGLIFKDFIAFAATKIQDRDIVTIEKQFSDKFQRDVICMSVKQPWMQLDAIIDPRTKRPIALSIPFTMDVIEPFDHSEFIEYDIDLPEDFFDIPSGPDVLVLGEHLDTQFCNDPNYGMAYGDDEEIQDVCQRIAAIYLQAKIDNNIETIKNLHIGFVNRYGSSKMIEKCLIEEAFNNGRVDKVLEYKPPYKYDTHRMMVPCKVVKTPLSTGQRHETFSGVLVYLRNHNGRKSAVITGWFPRLASPITLSGEPADLAAAAYNGLVPGEFMQKWLVLGQIPPQSGQTQEAFKIDFDAEQINPAHFEQIVSIGKKEYQWHLLDNKFGHINLTEHFKDPHQTIYAWAKIEMREETALVLGVGSDDGVKVWLNGQLVHENWVSRGVTVDEDLVPVTFRQGTNHLVLKIQNQGAGPWGFCCRMLEE